MQLHITLYGAMRVVAGQSNVDLSFDTPSVTMAQVIEVLTAAYPRVRPLCWLHWTSVRDNGLFENDILLPPPLANEVRQG